MSIRRSAMSLAMRAKADTLNPFDVLTLVVRAAGRLDAADPLWRAIRDFGRAVCAEPDPVALAEAGNELLAGIGVLDAAEG